MKGFGRTTVEIINRLFDRPETPPLAFLVLLMAVLSVSTPGFFSASNFLGIMQQAAPIALVALAVNLIIISGEIDISMGSMVAVLAFVFAGTAQSIGDPWSAMIVTILCGAAFGCVNGLLTTAAGVPSIIATLGTLMVLRGALLILAGDMTLYAEGAARFFGTARVLGVPVEIVLMVVLTLVFGFISRQTAFGRYTYAAGGNVRAARNLGIPVDMVKFCLFVLVGIGCALTAGVFVGQVASMQANAASGLELKIIAAVVLGGTSLSGGRGANLSPIIGALLLSVILNATALNRVPPTFESLILGLIILAAVTFVGLKSRL
ncbi:ABC transporter permease [Rhizobium sp. C4]|uniref:ABC transporter permease n=1 Tax=Rhizobium sp. C4 TaxID=1349800 RepID=UPI001E63AA8D|nr:ABC transporter permease [Rhizobium sp. C4]MCD2175129.1 ABC transporter permease [Rhizobium sp. C4]